MMRNDNNLQVGVHIRGISKLRRNHEGEAGGYERGSGNSGGRAWIDRPIDAMRPIILIIRFSFMR